MALEGKLTKTKFEFYKDPKSKRKVFLCRYYKVVEAKNKISALILPSGISKRKKKGVLIRKDYNVENYKLIDKGKFNQRVRKFTEVVYIFRGNKVYKIRATQRGKKKDDLWVELVV